jgi:transporter family-2 protein
METLFVPISLLAGGLLAVQAGANAQLAKATGSPFAATTLQLSVGTAILLAAALLTGTASALVALPGVVWWHAVGGIASAVYVVSTILLFPRLGAVVSVGLFIAGQMLASLALDGFGLLGVPATGFAPAALAGTALVLAGAAAIVLGQSGGTIPALSRAGWILLALLAGAVLPLQGAVNAILRRDLGARPSPSAPSASWWRPRRWRRCCCWRWPCRASRGRGWMASPRCPGGAGSAASPAPPTSPPCSPRSR